MLKDYYQLLNLKIDCEKGQIKSQYYKLCLKYHPDKNNGDDKKFKEINEAYSILINDKYRRDYNIKYIFQKIELTENDVYIINHYYEKIIKSNEYKLFKLLYNSLPIDILKNKHMKNNQLTTCNKKIDIQNLHSDEIINFILSKSDYDNNLLKKFDIITKYGTIPIYLRSFDDQLIINNVNCELTINFIIK